MKEESNQANWLKEPKNIIFCGLFKQTKQQDLN